MSKLNETSCQGEPADLPAFNLHQQDTVLAAVRQAQRRLQHSVTRTVLERELERMQCRITGARLDGVLGELLAAGRVKCTGKAYWLPR
jgi:hypothetical protein